MINVLQILVWFPIILLIGYICERVLCRDFGPFNVIVNCIGFIGVIIHELCHFIMSVLVGIIPKAISVKLRSEVTGAVAPHGYVDTGIEKNSFLQAFLIGLAPLFISTWIFLYCLNIIFFNPSLNGVIRSENVPYVILACGFVCVSLIVGLTPSKADLRSITRAFAQDIRYSLYQIFLVLLSGFIVWVMLVFFKIILSLDIFYFALVFVFYYAIKYLFYFIKKLIIILFFGDFFKSNSNKVRTRKRYQAKKPHQLKIKENQW